jgi:uncharacterized MAPEG superfamily protein
MAYLALVTLLVLCEYVFIFMQVGRARAKYGIKAPATTGNEIFERYFRVQQNTIEQLVIFLPAAWLFGHFVRYEWAAALGVLFFIGRALYLRGYVADPAQRSMGFLVGGIANLILLVGALLGVLAHLLL